ncbi:MAG: hypothetical protein CSB33_05330 [Desulfobacterales bacterium]|nr:MAG: hypothetical protein CSB33_05330 [Desulfobacterales bacterium]
MSERGLRSSPREIFFLRNPEIHRLTASFRTNSEKKGGRMPLQFRFFTISETGRQQKGVS